MELSSPEFTDGGEMPWSMSAANENRFPPLNIDGVPPGTRSLALALEDLNSPVGGLTHWLGWNLPPDTGHLDALTWPPHAVVGMSDFGKVGYLGPIPPQGRHTYRFVLFALDTELDLPEGATRRAFDEAIDGHVIATAELEGSIERTPEGD